MLLPGLVLPGELYGGAGGVGFMLQFTGGSQVRNWVLDEVGLCQTTPVCRAGGSYTINGSLDLCYC